MMTPKWKHDCHKCSYLGSTFLQRDLLDWYTCGTGYNKTVIARHGDDGPEYWSLPVDVMRQGDTVRMLDDTQAYSGMQLMAEAMLKKEVV
jgi:hypothetical protein